jgi:hypothetical protein
MGNKTDRRLLRLLEPAPDAQVCAALRQAHPRHRAEYAAEPRPRPLGAGMGLAWRRRDGSAAAAEISLSAIGSGEAVAAAVRDGTEQRRAKSERLRSQTERDRLARHLQRSSRREALGQLAAGVAHEFSNPLLGVISSNAAVVAEVAERAFGPFLRQGPGATGPVWAWPRCTASRHLHSGALRYLTVWTGSGSSRRASWGRASATPSPTPSGTPADAACLGPRAGARLCSLGDRRLHFGTSGAQWRTSPGRSRGGR